jgi:NADPH-dependent 2,4-dienoyl-CoA reductase/sulfur reductase-like enzyme
MEAKYVLSPADQPKNIWVVGGGPAGMEAARVAAVRGHKVTLFDNRDKLGGQLLYADLPPHKGEWQTFVHYLTKQLAKTGVDVQLNTAVSAEKITTAAPDAVIVATGARSLIPGIPGVEGDNVATCIEVLTGRKETGQNVIVIGGGAVGCETAEYLHEKGKTVTIIEMLPEIGPDVDYWNRWILMDRLHAAGLKLIPNARAEEITAAGVKISINGKPESIAADSVVLAVGAKSRNNLLQDLEGKFDSVYPIGDCVQPQKVRQAVDAGFKVGMEI